MGTIEIGPIQDLGHEHVLTCSHIYIERVETIRHNCDHRKGRVGGVWFEKEIGKGRAQHGIGLSTD